MMSVSGLLLMLLGTAYYITLTESGLRFPGHEADCVQTGEATCVVFVALFAHRFITENPYTIFIIVYVTMLLLGFMVQFLLSPGKKDVIFTGVAVQAVLILITCYAARGDSAFTPRAIAAVNGLARHYELSPFFILGLAALPAALFILMKKCGAEISLFSHGGGYYCISRHSRFLTETVLTAARCILITGAVLLLGFLCFGGLYLVMMSRKPAGLSVHPATALIIMIFCFGTVLVPGVYIPALTYLLSYILYFTAQKKSGSLYADYQRA